MNYTNLNTTKRLVLAKEAILIVQNDPVLLERLAQWGYTEERLAEGLTKQEAAEVLLQDRNVSYGSGVAATAAVRGLDAELRSQLSVHRSIARRALKQHPGLSEQLRLNGRLRGNREQLVVRGRHFYSQIQALPEVQALLEAFGLTAAMVAERLVRVEGLATAMQEQQHKRAEAQVVTRRRREAMRDLDVWMIEFLGVARVAFRNEREQLRKLEGLPV